MRYFLKTLFCDHNFEFTKQFEVKSEFDIVHESGHAPSTLCSLTRKTVTDFKCEKCKKLKRLIVRTAR